MTLLKTLSGVWPLLLALSVNPAAADTGNIQRPATQKLPMATGNDMPAWHKLSGPRQRALAPLQGEWNALDADRKKKWLAIADKFDTMTPEQQARAQSRMHDWVALKPEQRRLARESYLQSKKLNPEQKSAKWERYQQLSDEEKQKLAASAQQKKRIATLPSVHVDPGKPIKQAPAIPPGSAKQMP